MSVIVAVAVTVGVSAVVAVGCGVLVGICVEVSIGVGVTRLISGTLGSNGASSSIRCQNLRLVRVI